MRSIGSGSGTADDGGKVKSIRITGAKHTRGRFQSFTHTYTPYPHCLGWVLLTNCATSALAGWLAGRLLS